AIAVSPDGRTLATFERSADFRKVAVRLWDYTTGKVRGQIIFAGPNQYVSTLRFTPDGRGLLLSTQSGSGIWEIATGQCRVMLGGGGHTAVSRNGRFVCTQGPNCVLV